MKLVGRISRSTQPESNILAAPIILRRLPADQPANRATEFLRADLPSSSESSSSMAFSSRPISMLAFRTLSVCSAMPSIALTTAASLAWSSITATPTALRIRSQPLG